MTYTSPDGTVTPRPTDAFLERIIRRQPGRYWQAGSGDAVLATVDLKGSDGKSLQVLDSEPALAFFLVEPHGFFFTYFQPGPFVEQFVPSAGRTSRPYVQHAVGGLDTYVPRRCFVPRETALQIVTDFVRTKQRSSAVKWFNRSTLNLPTPKDGDS